MQIAETVISADQEIDQARELASTMVALGADAVMLGRAFVYALAAEGIDGEGFGRADLIDRLSRHPLARAVRVDKLTLAALEATLTGPLAPVTAALHADADELPKRSAQ